jgi:ATP-dependent exoDNAse (exonuclease V) alpha subunit
LAYAITVYKSQGLTLSQAVLNLNQKEHCLGLLYVAVSRVKTLDSLLFKVPFDYERFIGRELAASKDSKDLFD